MLRKNDYPNDRRQNKRIHLICTGQHPETYTKDHGEESKGGYL